MNKFFNKCPILILVGFIGCVIIAFLQHLIFMEFHFSSEGVLKPLFIIDGIIGIICVLFIFGSFLLLWIEGWLYLFERWDKRNFFINLWLVFLLIIFNVLAALVFHFLRKQSSKMY